nr:hypothetical protein [Acidobacteriota bacterium]
MRKLKRDSRFARKFGIISLSLVFLALAFSSIIGTTQAALIFTDNFDDGVIDAAKWKIGILSRSSTQFDSSIVVKEQNGRLSITPRASASGSFYGGYVSASAANLTDSAASVEAAQKTTGNAATIFSVGIDKDNWFGFRAKGSSLFLESRKAGSTTTVSLAYSAVQHRFWRLRHNPIDGTIVFETSADGTAWTARRTIARQITITAVKIE